MKFRTKFDHLKVDTSVTDCPSATDPQYKDDCDINVVVSKFLRGAGLDNVRTKSGSYGDVSKFEDFHRMMDIVNEGTRAFMDVPSDIRAKFGNDPKAFYAFVTDPANKMKLVELGLAELFVPESEVVKVQVVNPTPHNVAPVPTT